MHPAELVTMFREKIVAQQRNVFLSVPKCRKPQANTVDPVVQLSPKTSRFHFLIEVPARCRDQPGHQNSSWRFCLSVGQRVQKIPLARSIEFADFIEECRPCFAPVFAFLTR